MTNKRVLVVGDANVAVELLLEFSEKGFEVDNLLYGGPIATWDQETIDNFAGELENGDWSAYEAVFFASTSERDVQRQLLQALENVLPESTLLLVSAMSYCATEIASWCDNPERVIGFGFVPPIEEVKCLEVCRALQSSEEAAEQATAFLAGLEREVVWVKDSAGLVLPRMVSMIINEAVTALSEGVASAEDIDTAMKLGTNYPYGPLEWADKIGLDQVYATMRAVYEEQGEDRYRPAPLLRRMVLAGHLGEFTLSGFYEYEGVDE